MICPLRSMQYHPKPDLKKHEQLDCLGEQCAWWLHTTNCCAVATLALHTGDIWDKLAKISDNMPHAGQFTK